MTEKKTAAADPAVEKELEGVPEHMKDDASEATDTADAKIAALEDALAIAARCRRGHAGLVVRHRAARGLHHTLPELLAIGCAETKDMKVGLIRAAGAGDENLVTHHDRAAQATARKIDTPVNGHLGTWNCGFSRNSGCIRASELRPVGGGGTHALRLCQGDGGFDCNPVKTKREKSTVVDIFRRLEPATLTAPDVPVGTRRPVRRERGVPPIQVPISTTRFSISISMKRVVPTAFERMLFVIRKRIEIYNADTSPLLNYYQQRGKLVTLEGKGGLDEIFARIVAAL